MKPATINETMRINEKMLWNQYSWPYKKDTVIVIKNYFISFHDYIFFILCLKTHENSNTEELKEK